MTLDERICGMKMYKLGDLCSDVVDCPHSTPEWKNEGIRVIRNFNIVNGSLDFSNGFFVDEETFEKRTQRACPEFEDLVISREAPMGAVCMIPKNLKCCLGQRLVLLKINKDVADPNYILFAIQSQFVQKQIQIIDQTGSIVSNLNIPDLKSLRIPLPSLPEQKKIASVLSAIDDKIALNKKMNQKLEKMAKRLYDYWFVQFDFPDKNGHPYKTTGGPMTYNPTLKREIPAGWEVKKLGESVEILKDGTHNPPLRVDNGIPLLTGTMFGDNFLDYTKATYISREDYLAIHSKYQPLENDIIITKIGTLGNVNILRDTDIPIAIHCNSALLRFKKVFGSYYPFFFCKSDLFQLRLKSVKGQSIQEFASLDKIASVLCEIPSEEILKSFNNAVEPIMRQLIRTSKEVTRLTALRDKLLPLLMNGQVEVK